MLIKVVKPAFDNNVDAYIPEQWANAGLMQLRENMVLSAHVNTDFNTQFARFGDVINTRRPNEFVAKRKARGSNITIQDATADNVAIPLDQHIHTSFKIHDVDSSKSFKELHDEFLVPGIRSLARKADLILAGQWPRFRANGAGTLASAASKAGVISVGSKMNVNKAPVANRNIFINPATHGTLIGLSEFSEVDKVGDTMGLREASMGRKFGLNFWMGQNIPSIAASSAPATVAGAVNNSGGYSAGTTVITVDGFTGDDAPDGCYVTIAGDDRPRRVASTTLTSGVTTEITLSDAIEASVDNNAVVTVYGGPLVNLVAGYAAGYDELIAYDAAGAGKAPQVGQLISFGTGTAEYAVIEVNDNGDGTGTILPDRPLAAAVTNNTRINLGPDGSFNMCIHPNAMTLVMRPLAPPRGGGAFSATAMDMALKASVRVTFSYDHLAQATVVTLDFLAGIQLLDVNLGAVLYSNDAI